MKKILVVDDEALNLKRAAFILKLDNYQVLTASSGMKCLSILETQKVDLVLLDIEMPIMNGMKTLECIRENAEFDDLPVMFLTSNASMDMVIEAGRLGAVGYVIKPFSPQDLLDRIKQALGD